MRKVTLGLIVGNRGFFPDHLADEGRKDMIAVLEKAGFGVVALTPAETPFGSVETREHAKKCADLFRKNASLIDGILVTLPNFGDERGVAETIRLANLNVPVLIQATPDNPMRLSLKDRRDSFCGKLSACNNLTQYGIKFSLTKRHTVAPDSPAFAADLFEFAAVRRVVKGLRNARLGAIGARPVAFNTVRYSEKILERSGIAVETLDLSEVFGRIAKLDNNAQSVQDRLEEIHAYVPTKGIPDESLMKIAKLAVVINDWMIAGEYDATSIQCWTSMEEYFGVVPCTVMSMLSNKLMPSACEVDTTGAIGMYALALATETASMLLDWNNNYDDDPDKCIVFHCSNLPKDALVHAGMGYQAIIAGTVGVDNTYGTIEGYIRPGRFAYARVATDDVHGNIRAYVGEGEFLADPFQTFGGAGIARIPDLQGLLTYLCRAGFEHHVAASHTAPIGQTSAHNGAIASALNEALGNYLGWNVYKHG